MPFVALPGEVLSQEREACDIAKVRGGGEDLMRGLESGVTGRGSPRTVNEKTTQKKSFEKELGVKKEETEPLRRPCCACIFHPIEIAFRGSYSEKSSR